jgi:hypothetical protein
MANELVLDLRLETGNVVGVIKKVTDAISSFESAVQKADAALENLWTQFEQGKQRVPEDMLSGLTNVVAGITNGFVSIVETAGKAMGTVDTVQKIGGAIFELGAKMENVGGFTGKLGTKIGEMGIKFSSFGDTIGTVLTKNVSHFFTKAGGSALGLAGKLAGVGAAGIAAFSAGWGIGRKISEFLGLDKHVEKFFSKTLDFLGLIPKAAKYEPGKRTLELGKERDLLNELGKKYGIHSENLIELRRELYKNKDAYNELSPEEQKRLKRFMEKDMHMQAYLKKEREAQGALKGTAQANKEVSQEMQKTTVNQDELNKKLGKNKVDVDKVTSSLNIMTDKGLKELNKETNAMVAVWKNSEAAMGGNIKLTDAQKDSLQAQMDKYVEMGQKVPANLQSIADKHGILTSKQQEWKEKTDAMKESLGLLTTEGARELREETDILVSTVERNKTAFENNSVAAATMRDRIQEQLDKYEGMNNVPDKLKALADEYGVVTSKQEALLGSLGILTKSGMSDLNDETTNLVDTLNDNSDAFDKNSTKARLAKEEIEKQVEKYKRLGEDAPPELLKVQKKFEDVEISTDEARKAQDEYSASLGFVKKEDVTAELDKMTIALKEQATQYKNNPELIAALTKKIEELRKKAEQSGADVPEAFDKQSKAVKAASDDYEKNKKKVINLTDEQKKMADALGMSDEKFKKFSDTTGKIGKKLSKISGHGKEVLGFLENTGIVSGETAKALGGLLDGVGQIGAGFTELAKNPFSGTMKILGGVVKSATNLFKLFAGDGVGEAIDREREMIDISEEMEEKIRDLEDALGDTHAATSMLMSEIIAEAEINEENFANYAQRTRDILCDLDSGALSIGETQEAIGSAFNELLSDAQRLGTEGSKEMIALLGDVRGRGLEVAEMQDYVNEKLDSGVSALQSYLGTFADTGAIREEIAALNAEFAAGTLTAEEAMAKEDELTLKQQELSAATADVTANWDFMQVAAMSTFHALEAQGHSFVEIVGMMQGQLSDIGQMARDNGLEISEGLQAMTDLSTFVSQHEGLATRIDSTRVMMEALGDSAFLTGNDFAMFAEQTGMQFEEVMTKTNDQEMALRLISPALEDLIKYSESYGYQIDDNTQALIDQAREEGVLAKEKHTDQEVTNRLLLSIAEAWGAHIPAGLRKFGEEFDESMSGVNKKTKDLEDNLSDVEEQFNGGLTKAVEDMETAAGTSFTNVKKQTGAWGDSLESVRKKITGNLTKAVKDFDKEYKDAMSGRSVITETLKWHTSLEDVDTKIKGDLVGTAHEMDAKFSHTLRNLKIKLKEAGVEGGAADQAFKKMADKMEKMNKLQKAERIEAWTPEETQRIRTTPIARMNLSDEKHERRKGDIIFEHITIQSENGEEAVKDFMTALKNNKYGVKNLIRKVAR